MKKYTFYIAMAVLVFCTACDPELDDKIDIGPTPVPSFTYEFIDPNNVRFTNTTSDNNFIANWDFGDFGTLSGNEVESNFPFKGDYPVTLTVFGKGGSGSTSQTINISQDDPSGCVTLQAFLTNCDEKIWKLNPAADALWVGPDPGTRWWSNSADDVNIRTCDWNDEYIFRLNSEYEYKDKGDLWGEGYLGFGAEQCYDISELSANRSAWKSGIHSFEIIPGSPDKIRLIGTGAYVGLRKAANGAEVSFPQEEITYDVIETRTEGTKDIILLEVNFGGGIWRFTLASE